jgi:general secretion pathway protein B
MSILLDALRRSESRRKLGQAPSIHASELHAGPAPESRPLIPVLMAVLALILTGWLGLRQFEPPEEGSGAESFDDSMAAATEGAAESPETESVAGVSASGRTPVENLQPGRDSGSRASQSSRAENGTANVDGEVDPEVAALEDARRERLARRFGRYRQETESGPDTSPVVAEQPARSAGRAEERQEATLPGEEHVADAGSVPGTEPLSYWALPQMIRDQMSELKISVLVYADDPAERFVLLNGERVLEADTLASGIMLEEIRRDGAVFIYRNYRFIKER